MPHKRLFFKNLLLGFLLWGGSLALGPLVGKAQPPASPPAQGQPATQGQLATAVRGPWTAEKVQALLARVLEEKVKEEIRKDKELQTYKATQATLDARQEAGVCKTPSIPWVQKECGERCLLYKPIFECKKRAFGRCILSLPVGKECVSKRHVCLPKKTTKTHEICFRTHEGKTVFLLDGKASDVPPFAVKVASSLKKAYTAMEKEVRRAKSLVAAQIKKRQTKITDATKASFGPVLETIRQKADALATQLVQQDEWKRRLLDQVRALLTSKLAEAASWAETNASPRLTLSLQEDKDHGGLQTAMQREKASVESLRTSGKLALLALGKAVGYRAMQINLACWPYAGGAKKTCLTKEIATGMRDLVFDGVSTLVQTAVDLHIIEPSSHLLAGAVAGLLGAVTAGIGALAYPIVYASSSMALQKELLRFLETDLRGEYNKLFELHLRAKVEGFASRFLGALPAPLLRCWGPKAICR